MSMKINKKKIKKKSTFGSSKLKGRCSESLFFSVRLYGTVLSDKKDIVFLRYMINRGCVLS